MTKVIGRTAAIVAMIAMLLIGSASSAMACSPPFERPTIRALGPAAVVVLGTTGERVAGGRLFHVERAWNGIETTPIVIAFKEGDPVGDCSYPMRSGVHLIIAPWREETGQLSADLGTLQADPASDDGRAYIAEAEALFGPGTIPAPDRSAEGSPAASDQEDDLRPFALTALLGAIVVGILVWVARRRLAASD